MRHDPIPFRAILATIGTAAVFAGPAPGKVVFSGYADFRLTPQSVVEYKIPAALATPGLLPAGRLESRTAALDSVGLFATTSLADHVQFLVDVTYRDIGYAAKTLRLQYAYLDSDAGGGLVVRAGKLMLPFGHLNQHRFYSFQQASVTPPTFHSSILGLPISDLGIAAEQSLVAGPVAAKVAAYGINGYGPVPGSRASFRNGTLPGGLTVAGNLGSRDANKKPAGGGRLVVAPAAAPECEAGGSYYAGHWDSAGRRMLQMMNAHLRAVVGPVDVLGEYLHLAVEGDAGFQIHLGGSDWRTEGFFSVIQWKGTEVLARPLVPWARIEDYRSRAAGGTGKEVLRSYAGGASWQALDGLALKLEVNRLVYRLPYPGQEELSLTADTYVVGASVAF